MKKNILLSSSRAFKLSTPMETVLFVSSRAFSLSTPLFGCLPLWTTVKLDGKKLQNATKNVAYRPTVYRTGTQTAAAEDVGGPFHMQNTSFLVNAAQMETSR